MDSAKLTKKQKKGLAFREKRRKIKDFPTADQDDHAIPIVENFGDVESPPAQSPSPRPYPLLQKKRKADDVDLADTVERARSEKRRKPGVSDSPSTAKSQETDGRNEQRYILFVGNLKFTTTREQVLEHFSTCDPPPVVRLLTPKATSKSTNKSKGCAFLEFTHRNALQQGLKLHQSELDGRRINVELTAGGGGKSGGRLEKLRTRNKALAEQRRKKLEKQTPGDDVLSFQDVPQRYSATSGMENPSLDKRTWSVGDDSGSAEKRGVARRGKKHRATNFGTGVNAIPVR